jgi:hypothetical protein
MTDKIKFKDLSLIIKIGIIGGVLNIVEWVLYIIVGLF